MMHLPEDTQRAAHSAKGMGTTSRSNDIDPSSTHRVYLLEGTQLACDTAAGVLILTPSDAQMHAMLVLALNAALALAAGAAQPSDALSSLPWSADIMLDDNVVE